MKTKKLSVALPVAALAAAALTMPTATAAPKTADAPACAPVKDAVSYAYKHDANTASITLTPITTPRCEDVVVSVSGWEFLDFKTQYPQKAVSNQTITLKADATEPVSASVPATCQNDAYWGTGPTLGTVNTRGGSPFQEIFVNWKLSKGTGADWALMPITGGLTASKGPCSQVSPPSPSPSSTPTQNPGGGQVAGPQIVSPPMAAPAPAAPVAPAVKRPVRLPHTGF